MNDITSSPAQRAEQAFRLVELIKTCQGKMAEGFLNMGRALALARDSRIYTAYAEHLVTFDDFLREIGIKRTWGYNAMACWRKFGQLNVQGIGHDRLIKMLPLNVPDEDKQEWLDKARDLPARGFHDEIAEARGKQTRDACEHRNLEQVHFCLDCGDRINSA